MFNWIQALRLKMGSGRWFKAVIRLKKVKTSSSKQTKEKLDDLQKDSPRFKNDGANGKSKSFGMPIEDVAAVRIQTAYRAYRVSYYFYLLPI
ncbi:hypothetical protein IC582_017849 [Cucumis melo]